MTQTEIETTFLARALPADLASCTHVDMKDIYFPAGSDHPRLRLRRQGEKYEITKKLPVQDGDSSMQTEETIPLTAQEYEALAHGQGSSVAKTRYYVPCGAQTAEVDVFTEGLSGLVLVDFEFASEAERDAFTPPEFCGEDVTQELFIAGGKLAGKTLADIRQDLDRLDYTPLPFTSAE